MKKSKDITKIKTLGELQESGYQSRSIKEELRDNLVQYLKNDKNPFEGIRGFDDSVLPEIERAILSRHNINLLGLRGQAKTRLARLMTNLLDDYIPVVKGAELNDDPFHPISKYARELVEKKGKDTPIAWLSRQERYAEKLATPDVTVADLIGDIDPIKAANQQLSYSDERVIHFGMVPRSHRGLFVINELPDLQPRLQVALFNILQEGDIQIRGFKLRLPLDITFVFTANPEDYTNRGTIVTPLKDRIESQILTHYPQEISIAQQITQQEAQLTEHQKKNIHTPDLTERLLEQISFEARQSEYVDVNSGVSARLSITGYENLVSTAERRALLNGEQETTVRIADFQGIIPSITGKIELVYEGEQEGPAIVAQNLINQAIRSQFPLYFPDPKQYEKKEKKQENPYQGIAEWFNKGNELNLENNLSFADYKERLNKVPGLADLVNHYYSKLDEPEKLLLMEFLLHGLAGYSILSKHKMDDALKFKDFFSSVMSVDDRLDEEGRQN